MNTSTSKPTSQNACIDLPGESVMCWRSADNLKVVLRKHRDVIFDLKLGTRKTYTVHSERSDFYNANEKKIVIAKRKEAVTFQDGTRMHLWVSRDFKGTLLLRCGDRLVMAIEPNKFDQYGYGDDPKAKPAPIIVTLNQTPPPSAHPRDNATTINPMPAPLERPASAPIDEQCNVVCVVEGTLDNAPQSITDFFKNGGGKSGLADVDPNEIATRNWILGQLSSAGAYAGDNWGWLRASIDGKTSKGMRLVKAKVHFVRGKIRFYFSGYSKFNSVFGRGGFGSSHERILDIFAGAGRTTSTFAAATKGIIGSVKNYAFVAFIFSSMTAIAEWKDDMSKDSYDLGAALITALLKAMIAAALTAVIVSLIMTLVMIAGSITVPVIAVGAVIVGVGALVSYGVDSVDKVLGRAVTGDSKSEGMSSAIAPLLRAAGQRIEQNFNYLLKRFFTDYQEISF